VTSAEKLLDLDEPDARRLRALAQSAVTGSKEDLATFKTYVNEAERFGVFPSVLFREATRDTVLAPGTSHEKKLAAGSRVVVWPSLAAFDKDVFEDPFEFKPGRPEQKYMTFGYGRHRCLGEHIGQILVHEILLAVFALPGVRRAPGNEGQVTHRGVQEDNFPVSLILEFDGGA
jgi:cytochrome P450